MYGKYSFKEFNTNAVLTQERMRNFDAGEVIPMAETFMKKAKDDGKPFFVWLNTSHMHFYTRLNDQWRYAAEKYTSEADYHGSGMLQHYHDIGLVLKWLEEQGLLENTVIWYSTDNGLALHQGGEARWGAKRSFFLLSFSFNILRFSFCRPFFLTDKASRFFQKTGIFGYRKKQRENRSFIMEKAIQLKVRKDLDSRQQHTILKLKGSLISKGYTEIIHILDQDEEFHINTFETPLEKRSEVQQYIHAFIDKENLVDTISIK